MAFNLFPQTDFRQMDLNYVLEVSKQAAANLEEYAADKEQVVATQAAAERALAAAQQDVETATQAATGASQDAQTASAAAGTATQAAASAEQDAQTASAAAQTAQQVQESIPANYTQLSNDVDALKSDLSAVERFDNKLIFEPQIEGGIGYVTANFTLYENSSTRYKKTTKIPCTPGDKFSYKGVGTYGAYSCFFFNGNTLISSEQYNSANSAVIINVPANTNYIAFASYRETENVDTVILEVEYLETLSDTEKQKFRTAIGALSEQDGNSLYVKKDTFYSENLFDKNDIVTDEYVAGDGFIQTTGYAHTGAIKVTAGSYVTRCSYGSYGNNALTVGIFNDSLTALTTSIIATSLNSDNTLMTFTVDNDCYIAYNVRNNSDFLNSLMLVPGNSIADYPNYYIAHETYHIIQSGVRMNESMQNETTVLSVKNGLYKSSISADGDSICYGNGYIGGYAKLIAEKNSMLYQNLGVGGGTIVSGTYSGDTPRHWICESMQNLNINADYIVVEGGVNDSSLSVPVGALSNGYTATLDTTTFYGALETIFKTLTTKYVGKKYGFIIPHRMSAGIYPGGNYYNAVYECAEKWGVPLLDLTKSVPPFDGFRNTTELDAIRTEYTTDGDGWHPTEKCYKEYYVPQIEKWLLSL